MSVLEKFSLNHVFILFILSIPLFCNFIVISPDSHSNVKSSQIKPAQEGNANITIDASFPELIFIEGELIIEILANISGELDITFLETSAGDNFFNVKDTFEVSNNSEISEISLSINPNLATVPSQYQFKLIIEFTEEGKDNSKEIFNETYESILGMGYLILFSILIIFGTAIIVILSQNYDEDVKKAIESAGTPSTAPDMSGLPAGKIKCPECMVVIDEGLTFCPECGVRIPEFLRYRPDSSSGIL